MSPTRKDPENLTLSPGNRETHGERKADFSSRTSTTTPWPRPPAAWSRRSR